MPVAVGRVIFVDGGAAGRQAAEEARAMKGLTRPDAPRVRLIAPCPSKSRSTPKAGGQDEFAVSIGVTGATWNKYPCGRPFWNFFGLVCGTNYRMAMRDRDGRHKGMIWGLRWRYRLPRAFIDAQRIDLVIFEALVKPHAAEEKDNSDMDALVSILSQVAIEKNVAVDSLSHARKAITKGSATISPAERGAQGRRPTLFIRQGVADELERRFESLAHRRACLSVGVKDGEDFAPGSGVGALVRLQFPDLFVQPVGVGSERGDFAL